MRSILLGAVAAALLPLPAAAQPAAEAEIPPPAQVGWIGFTPREGMFTTRFPTPPKKQVAPIAPGPAAPGRVVSFTSESPEGLFLASWTEYNPAHRLNIQAALASTRTELLEALAATLVESHAITREGAPGIEFTAHTPGVFIGLVRVYIIGRTPYILLAGTQDDRLDRVKAMKFFESFDVLPRR